MAGCRLAERWERLLEVTSGGARRSWKSSAVRKLLDHLLRLDVQIRANPRDMSS